MAIDSNKKGRTSAESDEKAHKKPYCKPDYLYERVFETMALACGKVSATQPQCRFNQKLS